MKKMNRVPHWQVSLMRVNNAQSLWRVSRAYRGKGVAFGTGNTEWREYDLNDSKKVKYKPTTKRQVCSFSSGSDQWNLTGSQLNTGTRRRIENTIHLSSSDWLNAFCGTSESIFHVYFESAGQKNNGLTTTPGSTASTWTKTHACRHKSG